MVIIQFTDDTDLDSAMVDLRDKVCSGQEPAAG